MIDDKSLYRVHYYRDGPGDIGIKSLPVCVSKLVFAQTEGAARRHVEQTVDNFEGFPDDRIGTPENSVQLLEFEIA